MRIIVIGGGIIGTSVAYRLGQGGADVTVLEGQRIGGGTSSTSYAWVNACEKLSSYEYFKLNFAGRAAHARIAGELDGAAWYPRPGILQWQGASAEAGGVDRADQSDKFGTLQKWGYPAELLDGSSLHRLEPEIAPEALESGPVIHYPEDGWCYPVLYGGAVAQAARVRYGVQFVTAGVARIIVQGDRCTGVVLNDGATVAADVVVNCAGRWANDVLTNTVAPIPLAPTAGIVAYTLPVGIGLRRGLRTPAVNVRPDGAGRLLLRAGDIDKHVKADAPAEVNQPLADELLDRARALLPGLAAVGLETWRIAIRPQPADGYSAIGPMPELSGYYACVTHSGVTLAPFIGEAVAAELLRGADHPELAAFRPQRFFTGDAA
jgi:glycine/D-amino acid oxidase-like deaminating enzyme